MSLAEDYGQTAVHRWASSASSNRATLAIAHNSVWVAECNSIVVGWIEVKEDYIKGLYVAPSFSRSGIGSLLMAHAESAIAENGAVTAHLDASPNAVGFYSQLGYTIAGNPKPDSSIPMAKCVGNNA